MRVTLRGKKQSQNRNRIVGLSAFTNLSLLAEIIKSAGN